MSLPHRLEPQQIILELAKNAEVFKGLLTGLSTEELHWKGGSSKWNLLIVLCHLVDEEIEDFRARVASVLEDPKQDLSPIDPEGWVLSRKYEQQDYEAKLNTFLSERERSISWLRSLDHPSWDNAHVHPRFGPASAKFFLNNWLAHDILHIRQIAKMKYEYLAAGSTEGLQYAGDL